MAETIRINTEEYNEEFSRKLKVGDSVLITGKIYSARDAAHKVMTEALARGEKLPILLNCAEVGRRNRILTNDRFLSHSLYFIPIPIRHSPRFHHCFVGRGASSLQLSSFSFLLL